MPAYSINGGHHVSYPLVPSHPRSSGHPVRVRRDRFAVTAMLTAFALGCALIVLAGLYSGGGI